MKNTRYYVVNNRTRKAVKGPFKRQSEAANFVIDDLGDSPNFGIGSRYMLGKWGFYPRTKEGNEQLKSDLINSGGMRILF